MPKYSNMLLANLPYDTMIDCAPLMFFFLKYFIGFQNKSYYNWMSIKKEYNRIIK